MLRILLVLVGEQALNEVVEFLLDLSLTGFKAGIVPAREGPAAS